MWSMNSLDDLHNVNENLEVATELTPLEKLDNDLTIGADFKQDI